MSSALSGVIWLYKRLHSWVRSGARLRKLPPAPGLILSIQREFKPFQSENGAAKSIDQNIRISRSDNEEMSEQLDVSNMSNLKEV